MAVAVSVTVAVKVDVAVMVGVGVCVATGPGSSVGDGWVVAVCVIDGSIVFVGCDVGGTRVATFGTNSVCPASSLEPTMQLARISISCETPKARLRRKIVSPGFTM